MSNFFNTFYKCLIEGNSYYTVAKGLGVTVGISIMSVIIGFILGLIICILRVGNNKVLRQIARVYIALLRGTPVLMILMLMYYVVFANTNVSSIFVAVVAFSLNCSSHMAELMRSSYEAIDKKQIEAARTLGLSKVQTFLHITLPQSVAIAKPVLQSTIVNLIQWTSVLGYITIIDLTRVVNNISARTMEPLFMIVVGMLLYLLLSYIVYGIFSLLDKYDENKHIKKIEE